MTAVQFLDANGHPVPLNTWGEIWTGNVNNTATLQFSARLQATQARRYLIGCYMGTGVSMMTRSFCISLCLGPALWLCGNGTAFALDWKAGIILSPAAMNYSGPADSVAPGNIIGSQWSATATVGQVFWCGMIFLCTRNTMEPTASAVPSGLTVEIDGVTYSIFETGVPGIGYILGLKDASTTHWIPLQEGITQTYASTFGVNDLGWSTKITFVKTNATLTASGCVVFTRNTSINLGQVDSRDLPDVGSTSSGTANQFFINSTSAQAQLNLPFQVRYVRTGPLVPGTANALAGIPFSCQ